MDPGLLAYYNRELQYLREVGGEFAEEFPKVAGRLGLDGFECADPYVERLLEGFAFLAARVQLKLDAQFPRFTQHLLEMVYPHYLAPTPSMAVVQFQPDLTEGALGSGYVVPRESALRSLAGKGEQAPCEYRTAHDVTLWPLQLTEATYYGHGAGLARAELPSVDNVRAALRLKLRVTAGLTCDKLALDKLPIYLRGNGESALRLYEQLLGNVVAVIVRPAQRPAPWYELLTRGPVRPLGFEDNEALLPYGPRSFQGYRLLHEYFAFPQRYLFAELVGLGNAVRRCKGNEFELVVLFNRSEPSLVDAVELNQFALFCSPAVNIFPRRADRIHLSDQESEWHLVPDRTRPMDFEVYSITDVVGYGASSEQKQEFRPFYALHDNSHTGERKGYFTVRRERRVLSARQRSYGPRTSYVGSEVFISLADDEEAPYRSDLRQLAVGTLCTNRDLPLIMTVGQGRTDFTMESGAPVESVRCVAGPTEPRPSYAEGDTTWRLISHLALNYLSLTDSDEAQGASALRELLQLYGDIADPVTRKQIEGVKSVQAVPVVRPLPGNGLIGFGRGVQVTLSCEDAAFEGTGVFLLGAVLERFFGKYVSLNSFTETILKTARRGEVMRWPVRSGLRQIL